MYPPVKVGGDANAPPPTHTHSTLARLSRVDLIILFKKKKKLLSVSSVTGSYFIKGFSNFNDIHPVFN